MRAPLVYGLTVQESWEEWLGWLGFPIGVALLLGSLEFVGSNEKRGWSIAALIVPIAYIAWSLWLIVIGVSLIL